MSCKMKKIICLIVLATATVDCFPASLRFHLNSLNDVDEKRFSIDDAKNLLMESNANKDYPMAESLAGMQDRLKRRLSDYTGKSRSPIPDEIYYQPFAPRPNYGNENPESFYDGLKTQDENAFDAGNDDGSFDDGLWLKSFTRPHYEFPAMRRSENIAKRFKARKFSENNYYNY